MEFFDKLGEKATKAYKVTADKTEKLAKEAKTRMKINELRSHINDLYEEIGKKVYEKHVREENINIKEDLEEQCTQIDILSDEIESLLKHCMDLKDKKECQNCYKQIEKNMKFCPECGAKQTSEEPKEVEVIEILEEIEVEPKKEKEKEIILENLNEKIKEKENIDSKVENETTLKEDNKKSKKQDDNKKEDTLEKTIAVEANIELNNDKNE